MSLLDSLGLNGMTGLMGQNHQHMSQQANQAFNNAYNQYSGQISSLGLTQQQMYNQALSARQETKWKFNGVDCSIREMADMIWTSDCPEKTHFLLKYE